MHLARNLIHGAAGGLVAGSIVGLVEAAWLIATSGAPDLWSLPYAVVLYGVFFGIPFGIGTGVVVTLAERWFAITEPRAFALGAIGGMLPLSLFIVRYIANEAIYAEQGVPLVGDLAILAAVGAVALLVLFAVPALLRGPLAVLLKGPGVFGAWGGLVAVGVIAAVVAPAEDPRGRWDHGKALPQALADRPNVLFVMVDTLRADHVGAYGGKVATPTLDAIARDGVVFERSYANASWTRASTASLFTSRIPSGHNAALKASRLPDGVVTWAEVLQPAGYATGALVNNINVTETFNFDQGFDTFVYEAPAYRFGATESVVGLAMYKVVHKLAEKALGKQVERFYQPADVVLADAKGFVEANRDGRWALFVHLMEPHDPYFEHPSIDGSGAAEYNGVGFARAEVEHPDPADADYLARLYAGEVAFLDQKLAPFVAWLKAEGLYDETVIVITADHGEELYEHGGWWHGTTLYDEQLHVPLIVKLPKQELAGTRVPWQVRSIDVAPTLAVLAGQAPDASWEGHELVTEARAELAPAPAPDPLCVVHPLDRPLIAEEDFEGNQLLAHQAGGFKYIRANEGNPRGLPTEALFHLPSDPGEQKNLRGSGSAVCGADPESRAKSLDAAMGAVIGAAKRRAPSGGTAKTSAAECERLEALGYLAADEPCGE